MKIQFKVIGMLCSCAIFTLVACGKQNAFERTQVQGMVTFNGTPVDHGVITFIPAGKGASAGAKIESGKFSIPQESGPSPGEYRVEIDSSVPTGKQILDTDGETMVDEYTNGIPPRFNRETELKVTLKRGNNQHLFDLETE
ncbi:hypothetical protein V6x_52390 [Gimesia chilikensis]|uniref:Carboxypeptidase regulatory-like domain-containing protein n=1 Tax=Gimesia chilikensis TaxID=2605989 RepID=A0A517WJR7_9PLAN|nr:hypothetical protein [Gimesia chilikensis]QDU05502.1 hypothetical protein V6x_52390 [Gimesia chilikensis]